MSCLQIKSLESDLFKYIEDIYYGKLRFNIEYSMKELSWVWMDRLSHL